MPQIYYLNKPQDAAGLGHAAILVPSPLGYTYYSFYANRRFLPFSAATLLIKDFPSAPAALAYAKTEGYTREMHWPVDLARCPAAHHALVSQFATGTRWRILSRNCWHAVHAALTAAGISLCAGGFTPNAKFEKNKIAAQEWSHL